LNEKQPLNEEHQMHCSEYEQRDGKNDSPRRWMNDCFVFTGKQTVLSILRERQLFGSSCWKYGREADTVMPLYPLPAIIGPVHCLLLRPGLDARLPPGQSKRRHRIGSGGLVLVLVDLD
jgi:hypothetical protein